MKQIRKILFYLIMILFSYGLLTNIQHIISINQKYHYSFDDSIEILAIKSSITTLEQDIEKIKRLDNSLLGDDIVNTYIQILENINEKIKNCEFINYKGNIQLKQKDLYQMLYDYGNLNYSNLLNVYKKLVELNPSLDEEKLTWQVYTMMLSSNYIYETFVNNYIYNNSDRTNNYTIQTILSLYEEKLNTVNMISELVLSTVITPNIENGEVNE